MIVIMIVRLMVMMIARLMIVMMIVRLHLSIYLSFLSLLTFHLS